MTQTRAIPEQASSGRTAALAAKALQRDELLSAALGLVLGLAVVGPLIGDRPLFLLDWVVGPHAGVVSPGLLGLNGGLTTGPLGTVVPVLARVFGAATTWLVVLVFFPVASVGVGRLVNGSPWAKLPAATLYAVNPFVFNRLYAGHLALLFGYALLPFAVSSALAALGKRGPRVLAPALWWAVLTALSPHFAWIFGVVLLGVLIVKRPWSLRQLGSFAAICAAFAVMSLYILLPHEATQLPSHAGSTSLAVYRTAGDPHYGLFVNVLGLYGFWRTGPGPQLPKQVIAGWPLLLLAILTVAAVGAWHVLRPARRGSQPVDGEPGQVTERQKALVLLAVGVAGFFLSLGNQGPTGTLFSWAYYHVPFFQVMREPQKFLMLLALAYAVLFGWGVERLSQVDLTTKGARTVAGTLGVAIPLVYCPTIFWGLTGQVSPSDLPAAYSKADALMGTGQGEILYLPWHLYMSYPFIERVVTDLAPTSFRRTAISGDNIQVGDVETQSTSPRSAYIQDLLAKGGQLKTFGALVAPLGVQFVVLAKTVNWTAYRWLDRQKDLRRVYDSRSLEVWSNQDYGGVGVRVSAPLALPDLNDIFRQDARSATVGGLDGGAVRIGTSSQSVPSALAVPGPLGDVQHVRELSPVAYRVPPGTPGWVTVDTTYQEGWVLDGRRAEATAEGTMMFPVGKSGGVARFQPWGSVKLGYWLSSLSFLVVASTILLTRGKRPLHLPLRRN